MRITKIEDILPAIAHKPEISVKKHENGLTTICYMFAEKDTFNDPISLECRGIAFDDSGICSRPFQKFFNMGEKPGTDLASLLEREKNGEVAAIYEKFDGSMIATAFSEGKLYLRSKKSFSSDVVKLAEEFLKDKPDHITFTRFFAERGYTCIFELTHPQNRIVVKQDEPKLTLLQIRHNITGEYNLNIDRTVINRAGIDCAMPVSLSIQEAVDSLPEMKDREGHVVFFKNGDMVKIKCPWYLRLHRSISMMRERDIAEACLNETIDDLKAALVEAGVDLAPVEKIESDIKETLIQFSKDVEEVYERDKHLSRKDFAMRNKTDYCFPMLMDRYSGKEIDIKGYYRKHCLNEFWGLNVIGAVTDE